MSLHAKYLVNGLCLNVGSAQTGLDVMARRLGRMRMQLPEYTYFVPSSFLQVETHEPGGYCQSA